MNDNEAFKWFQLAAQNDNSDAAYLLGECYASGLGVDLDLQADYGWFHVMRPRLMDNLIEEIGDSAWAVY